MTRYDFFPYLSKIDILQKFKKKIKKNIGLIGLKNIYIFIYFFVNNKKKDIAKKERKKIKHYRHM